MHFFVWVSLGSTSFSYPRFLLFDPRNQCFFLFPFVLFISAIHRYSHFLFFFSKEEVDTNLITVTILSDAYGIMALSYLNTQMSEIT